jgi:hypothetical protein
VTTWTAPTDADRLWGSVITAMPPPHEYVAAASELQAVVTDVTHDWLHPRQINEIGKSFDTGYASQQVRHQGPCVHAASFEERGGDPRFARPTGAPLLAPGALLSSQSGPTPGRASRSPSVT